MLQGNREVGNQTIDETERDINKVIEEYLIEYQDIPDAEKDAKLQNDFQKLMDEIEAPEYFS